MRIPGSEDIIQHYVYQFKMNTFLNNDLLTHMELFKIPAYNNVYIEEDEQHFFYFLVDGQVQCHHYHLNGRLAVFAISNPFSAIGDVEILNDEPVRSNVITTQDTTLLGIARPVVNRYGANDPHFLRFLIDQLRDKLYRTNNLQMNQVLAVINRLAVFLLAQPQTEEILFLPDKEALASLLGTTTRHLNRTLKQLVDDGFIRNDYPQVQILDRAGLESLCMC